MQEPLPLANLDIGGKIGWVALHDSLFAPGGLFWPRPTRQSKEAWHGEPRRNRATGPWRAWGSGTLLHLIGGQAGTLTPGLTLACSAKQFAAVLSVSRYMTLLRKRGVAH